MLMITVRTLELCDLNGCWFSGVLPVTYLIIFVTAMMMHREYLILDDRNDLHIWSVCFIPVLNHSSCWDTYEMRTATRTIANRAMPKRRLCMVVNPNPLRMRAENCRRCEFASCIPFDFLTFNFQSYSHH